MYLTHQPILVMMSSLVPSSRTSILSGVACCVVTLVLVALIADIGERRKNLFSCFFRQLIGLMRPDGPN